MILMGTACMFSMSLIFVNRFTGILFSIDSQNTFTWGPCSALPDDIALVQSPFLLSHQKAVIACVQKSSLWDSLKYRPRSSPVRLPNSSCLPSSLTCFIVFPFHRCLKASLEGFC